MWARALALCCAVVALSAAAAYTVDCNHEYTDCDTELSKIANIDDEELPSPPKKQTTEATTSQPTRSTHKYSTETTTDRKPQPREMEVTETIEPKAKGRLLNLNVDELQNFANALHNQTNEKNKKVPDLSDVNLDDDEEDPRILTPHTEHKGISDSFYTNLQAPFNHPVVPDRERSEEVETCKENEVLYKIGEKIDRGCEETCECSSGGIFECSPRCKHPYIRRGRRLNDPLCFESPVDECCSIIACATSNGEAKPTTKIAVCRYGNQTHAVGEKWHIGCEQTCTCEPKSVITCKPRCKPLITSDKCINVQDPNDACCEIQVCDVSQDVHELSENVTSSTRTSTTKRTMTTPTTMVTTTPTTRIRTTVTTRTTRTTTTTEPSTTTVAVTQLSTRLNPYEIFEATTTTRPLYKTEPIGSVKVLQNNTVQVNLIHLNKSEDPIHLLLSNDGGKTFEEVELKYRNLILNLKGGKDYVLKTKETGTKFNFTITATDSDFSDVVATEVVNDTKPGCWENDMFYNIGEEFHIGCSELCECIGPDTRECAALICPNHVGLELMSKGCVRWAPSPPAQPPNCCPRTARCLSDGTCHYNGIPIPNWTEVPITLTGCEQRCFCENGELDCQEVCTPLNPVPPQNLRCPPMFRPAHVNISDEDCCKQWGCVPNVGSANTSTFQTQTFKIPIEGDQIDHVTRLPPEYPSEVTPVLPTPPLAIDAMDFYKKKVPSKSFPKVLKTVTQGVLTSEKTTLQSDEYTPGDNITVFTLDDIESPFKTIHAQPPLVSHRESWNLKPVTSKVPSYSAILPKTHTSVSHTTHTHPEKELNIKSPHPKVNVVTRTRVLSHDSKNSWGALHVPLKPLPEAMRKVPMSSVDNFNYFLPTHDKRLPTFPYPRTDLSLPRITTHTPLTYFEPKYYNRSDHILIRSSTESTISYRPHPNSGKHVTVLKSKDLRPLKESGIWVQDTKTHVLNKLPNPYESVLMNAVISRKGHTAKSKHKTINPKKSPSTINLEHLLSQMELESEVNRNLGRSADQSPVGLAAAEGHDHDPDSPHQAQTPPFLPTIRPDIHYPNEDIPDYDQNNLHRPALEAGIPGLPSGLQVPASFGDMNKKLTVISIDSDSPNSIKMLLGLPSVLVGLRGSVDLRYTDTADEEVAHWSSQVFAPADEILTTPRLEFRLTGLKPSTTYKIRGKLYLHNLPVSPESETYSVRTLDLPVSPSEEKRREIDSRLSVVEVNDTTALLNWRHFTEDELQLIDGIQVRYRPVGTPIYSMTELLHHSRSAAHLVELRPNTRYEAGLVLVPPPRVLTELWDRAAAGFTTLPLYDPYNWTVTIEARTIGALAAEIMWQGIPSPAERWVRVYRAAHACGEMPGKEHDEFRLASRDQPPSVTLIGLPSDTRCRVWLELFLTNGKVKTSNVIEINTKTLDTDNPVDNEVEASSISGANGRSPRGDYYSALVGVGVVAALGALASLLLLLVVLRRHRPRSVPITPVPSAPRESSLPPYDNPAYKLELQQETMDL